MRDVATASARTYRVAKSVHRGGEDKRPRHSEDCGNGKGPERLGRSDGIQTEQAESDDPEEKSDVKCMREIKMMPFSAGKENLPGDPHGIASPRATHGLTWLEILMLTCLKYKTHMVVKTPNSYAGGQQKNYDNNDEMTKGTNDMRDQRRYVTSRVLA